MIPPPNIIRILRYGLYFLFSFSVASYAAQTMLTVRDAEFRNRWAGPQEDKEETPQYFEPDGGLGEDGETMTSAFDEKSSSNLGESLDRMANNFSRGLRFGPLDFQLGITTGWEYSSQNSVGSNTNFADNNSFFAAPSIAVVYNREVGVWTLALRAASGYRYYFSPGYTAAGTGFQRNPISLTGGFDLGYNTERLTLNISGTVSSGTGYDIVAGSNNLQASTSGSFSARYLINDSVSTGGAVSLSYTNTSNAQVPEGEFVQPDSNALNAGASAFVDYLVTPKTNTRFVVSAGQDLQSFEDGLAQGRKYVDTMIQLTYQIAPKFSVSAGGGVGYVADENILDPNYTGLRPVYTGEVNYTPTEKTFFKANVSMQGADIRPNFGLQGGWNLREKTRLSVSFYQNQGFSSLSPDQYNVTQGVMGTIAQRLVKGVSLSFSGGYERSEYVALSSLETNAVEGPAEYWLTGASLSWQMKSWVGWQNTLMFSSGRGLNSDIQTQFNTSLNFSF